MIPKIGDIVLIHLYGRLHDEPGVVVHIKRFQERKDGREQAACQVLWKGKLKWLHSDKIHGMEGKDETG